MDFMRFFHFQGFNTTVASWRGTDTDSLPLHSVAVINGRQSRAVSPDWQLFVAVKSPKKGTCFGQRPWQGAAARLLSTSDYVKQSRSFLDNEIHENEFARFTRAVLRLLRGNA